jgi:hypothetical protein
MQELEALFGVPKTMLRIEIASYNNNKFTYSDQFGVHDEFLVKSPICPTSAMDNIPSTLTSKSSLKRICEFTVATQSEIALGFHCAHYNYEINCGDSVHLWLLRGKTFDYIGNDDFLLGFSRKISFQIFNYLTLTLSRIAATNLLNEKSASSTAVDNSDTNVPPEYASWRKYKSQVAKSCSV